MARLFTLPRGFPLLLAVLVPEEELVRRLVARDERAFGILYEKYGSALLGTIKRLVRDEVVAQDILQESLLKVWLNIARYDAERGRLFTWMARICTNLAIDFLRSPRYFFDRNSQSLEVSFADQMASTATFNPEHIGLRELVLHLKPAHRDIVNLYYFGGYTQAEIAEHLDMPLATVKTRVRAALLVLTALGRVS